MESTQAYLIEKLECVQRNVTRWTIGKDTPYENRLKSLKLPTLVQRRGVFSLVQLFKFMKGHFCNTNDYISFSNRQSGKSHQYKLYNPFLIIIYYICHYQLRAFPPPFGQSPSGLPITQDFCLEKLIRNNGLFLDTI